MYHWAPSSAEQAMCAFEPTTTHDIGVAVGALQLPVMYHPTRPLQLRIIGENMCPFAASPRHLRLVND